MKRFKSVLCCFQSAISFDLRSEELFCFIMQACSAHVWFPAATVKQSIYFYSTREVKSVHYLVQTQKILWGRWWLRLGLMRWRRPSLRALQQHFLGKVTASLIHFACQHVPSRSGDSCRWPRCCERRASALTSLWRGRWHCSVSWKRNNPGQGHTSCPELHLHEHIDVITGCNYTEILSN